MINLPEFNTVKEKIDYLIANKTELIDIKKSAIKNFVDAPCMMVDDALKGIVSKSSSFENQDTDEIIYRTIVGNTYNWMDSHEDVHVGNTFLNSINQKKASKIYHRHDHINQLTAKVGNFNRVYEEVVNWTDLGVNKVGQTIALMADTSVKRAYNQLIFEAYKDGEIDQHSVGMQYVRVDLAVNNPDSPDEFKTWNKWINSLGNQDKAIKLGYFWAVSEAKLIEISCVTEGSNSLTPTLPVNPLKGNLYNEPKSITREQLTELLKTFKN